MANELEAIYLLLNGRWMKGRCETASAGSMGARTMSVYVPEVLPLRAYKAIERPDPTFPAPDPERKPFTRLHGGPGEPVVYLEDKPKRKEARDADPI